MANLCRYRNKYNKNIVMTLTRSPRRFLRSVTGEAPATSQSHKNHNQAINAGSALLLVLAFVLTYWSYLFCRRRRRSRASLPVSFPDAQSELDAIAIVIYSRPQGRNQDSDSDSEAENCTICLAEFEVGENVRMLPRCKHVFHVDCIDRWLVVRSLHCPVCRDRTIQAPPQTVKTSCNSSAHDTASLALVEFGTTRTFAGHITSYT